MTIALYGEVHRSSCYDEGDGCSYEGLCCEPALALRASPCSSPGLQRRLVARATRAVAGTSCIRGALCLLARVGLWLGRAR